VNNTKLLDRRRVEMIDERDDSTYQQSHTQEQQSDALVSVEIGEHKNN
jgi:hypothetical protein